MQSLTWVREQGFGGLMLKSIPKAPGAGMNQERPSFSELKSTKKGEYGCTDMAELVFIDIYVKNREKEAQAGCKNLKSPRCLLHLEQRAAKTA